MLLFLMTRIFYFNLALECAIRNVQETRSGLDMNGTHQVLAYADDVNLIGDDMSTLGKEKEGKKER